MEKEKIELPLLKGSDREKCIPLAVIIGLIFLLVIFLIACLSLTFKGTYTLHYDENSRLDYKVYLVDNDYYDVDYLPKDKQYISTLIDYVDATFDYAFKSDENIGLEYSYYVKAAVMINNTDGRNIYEKDETLVDKKQFTDLSNNTFKVSERLKISYDKYNDLAKQFISDYNLNAEATLVVSLYVDVAGKHAEFDKKISDKAVVSLKIPLTSRTVDIEMDYDLSNSVDEVLQYRTAVINNPTLFAIAIALAMIDVATIIAIVIWIIRHRDDQTLYNKKLDKILREYDRYICETVITERVEDMMKTRSLRIEIIKSFEDLVDIRDNLGKPILYHEERPGQEAVFYIITERVGYIYVMRADELRNQKKRIINSRKKDED